MRNRRLVWTVTAVVVVVGLLAVFMASGAFTKTRTGAQHQMESGVSCPMIGAKMDAHNGGQMPCGMDTKACQEHSKSGNMGNCPMHESMSGDGAHGHMNMNMQDHEGMSGCSMAHGH